MEFPQALLSNIAFLRQPSIMSSPLEKALPRLQIFSKGPSLGHFLKLHLAINDMLNLRLASRSLRDLFELNKVAFETIHIHTPVPPGREQQIDALAAVAIVCRHIVVKIAFPFKASNSPLLQPPSAETSPYASESNTSSEILSEIVESYCPYVEPPIAWKFVVQRKPGDVDQVLLEKWCQIFKLLSNMETLHIACNGDPAWPGCTDIESLLVILRIALERTNPEHLQTVRLSPIHAMGIMHLRWAGAGAYGEACAARDPVWYRLKVLELQILNPYHQLSKSQTQVFDKIFTDYLQSFSRTLTRLDISWIGADGPDPFAAGDGHPNLKFMRSWSRLEELWLGRVKTGHVSLIKQLAPHLQRLMVASDVLDKDGESTHQAWDDRLVQNEDHHRDDSEWMALRDVRLSALPAPLFQNRLA